MALQRRAKLCGVSESLHVVLVFAVAVALTPPLHRRHFSARWEASPELLLCCLHAAGTETMTRLYMAFQRQQRCRIIADFAADSSASSSLLLPKSALRVQASGPQSDTACGRRGRPSDVRLGCKRRERDGKLILPSGIHAGEFFYASSVTFIGSF